MLYLSFAPIWRFLSCLLLTVLLGASAYALEATEQGRYRKVYIVPAPAQVVIDGDLKEWDRSGQLELFADPATRDRRFGRLAFMRDEQALYIGGEVGNLVPLTNPNDPAVNPEFGWNGDAMQVRMAIDRSLPFPLPQSLNRTDAPGIMHLALWCYVDKMQPVLQLGRGMKLDYYYNPAYPKGVVPADKFSAMYVKLPDNRYRFEYRIPWVTLGATNPPRAGDIASLTMQLHWSDKNPGSVYQLVVVRDVMMGSGFGFQAVDSWGKAIYSSKGNLPAEVTQPATPLPPPLPMTFSYDLPRDAEVTIALQDAQGRYVRSLESQVKHKKGNVTVAWDGLDEYGKVLPAGKYSWKGIYHDPITTKYVMSVHNSGQPGYFTEDGKGSWGGDHGVPVTLCAGPDFMLFGWNGCEVGKGVIRTDLKGRKQAGFTFAADWLATDGERFYVYNEYHKTGIQVHRVADGRPMAYGNGVTALYGPNAVDGKTPVPLTGLAWTGGEVFAAYEAANVIIVFDAVSGAEKRRFNVTAPRGVAALPGVGLAAISAGKLVRIDAVTGAVTTLATTHLDAPYAVAVAADKTIFISNRGKLQNVSVFALNGPSTVSRQAKYLCSIGKSGGRPGLGAFNKKGMFNPAGITVDSEGKLWVAEADASPKRISVWNAKTSKLIQEFFGPSAYAAHVAVDPARPTEAFCHNTLWNINIKNGTWYPKTTFIRQMDPNSPPAPGSQGLTATVPLTADNGRQYFFMHTTYGTPFTVWRRDGDVGRPFLMIVPRMKYMDGNWQKIAPVPVFWDNERFPADDTQPYFAWQDGNDDGVIQPDEVQRIAYRLWMTSMAGGWQLDRGLKLYNLTKGVAFTPIQITRKGQPLYDFRKPERLSAEPWDKALQGEAGFFLAEDGKSFFAFNQNSPEGRGVARWSLDGKLLWRTGGATTLHWKESLSEPVAKPGELYGIVSPMRTAGGIVGWASYFGVFHLFTDDGLYVAKCFRDMREGQVGPNVLFTEHFCGILTRIKATGRTYILGGDLDGRITEVLGLDSIKKFDGAYEITPADIANADQARAEYAARQVAVRSLKITRGKAALPTAAEVVVTVDDKRGFDARLAVDEKNLYLDYEVRTPVQLVNNTDNPQILFRGGNVLDLQLATDPNADSNRVKAVPGDIRLLVSRDKTGKPVAVLYRTKVKGFTGQPIALTSVVQAGSLATENFDSIEIISDKITLDYTPRSIGFGATVTIPLELIGWKPDPGKPVHLDIGYLFGDTQGNKCMLRSYWTNKSQLSGIINDVPSESRLEPKEWGVAVVEAAPVVDDQQVGNSWQGKPDPAAHFVGWSARKPVVKDGNIPAWEIAPEFLKWRDADPVADGFAGRVLTVNLTGPFADGAWSQHAGALLRLDQEVPAKQSFTVRFKARSLSGSKYLSVLRSWGGATPWESTLITTEWKEYTITLTPTFPTDTLSFSLVPKAGQLQPYCAGSFELATVRVVI
jgi:hypothetical protein